MGIPKKKLMQIVCEIKKDGKLIHGEVVGYIFKEKVESLKKTQALYENEQTELDFRLEEVRDNKKEKVNPEQLSLYEFGLKVED